MVGPMTLSLRQWIPAIGGGEVICAVPRKIGGALCVPIRPAAISARCIVIMTVGTLGGGGAKGDTAAVLPASSATIMDLIIETVVPLFRTGTVSLDAHVAEHPEPDESRRLSGTVDGGGRR